MKAIFLSIIMLISLMTFESNAQRDLMSDEVNTLHQEFASKCNRKLVSSTKNLYFFTTWKAFGEITMVKGEGFYCFIVRYGALPEYVKSPGNLTLILSNGEIIKLHNCSQSIFIPAGSIGNTYYLYDIQTNDPNNAIKGVQSNLKTSSVFTNFYEITQNDLQEINKNGINLLNIFYTPDLSSDAEKDKFTKDGYLEYEINKGYKKFHKAAAEDILSN